MNGPGKLGRACRCCLLIRKKRQFGWLAGGAGSIAPALCMLGRDQDQPAFLRKVAELYFSVRCDLSRIAWTFMPRLWVSSSALAIGADVKL